MNQFAEAFKELLDSNDAAFGTPQFVLIKGKKCRAIILEVSSEIIEAVGGKADAGGFSCQIPTDGAKPKKGDSAKALGVGPAFEILGGVRNINNASYEFVCGDPAAVDR